MNSVVVGTAGHIDHGKSALVQALTGIDPDRLKEEKARGITIDLGFAHAAIDGINFAFVDVPGHERFVKNMLAGVGGIDLVVLVVAADESVMPQTREHFDICRMLQVPSGIIALTKADLADAEMLELARLEVRELVSGSFLEDAPLVPLSARNGSGLDAFRRALVDASARGRARRPGGAARLPIDRVFSMKGFGTVVTGTLVTGTIGLDRDYAVVPGSRMVKVRGVQVHGQKRNAAVAGERAAVNLGGIEVDEIARGQNLVTPGAFVESRVVDAVIEVLASAKPLKHGSRVRFHQGTAEIIGRIGIVGPPDQVGSTIGAGERGFARLRLEAPAALARGDRYILRTYSPPATIAGGSVLDPAPPRGRIRSEPALLRCQALARANDPDDAAAILVADSGPAGLPSAALVWRVGVDPDDVDALVARLAGRRAATVAGDVVVAPAVVSRLSEQIVATLTEYHRTTPLSEGIPREELRSKLFRRGHPAVFARTLADLAAEGRIVLRDRVALSTHRMELSPEEQQLRDAIERMFRDAALTPPDVGAVAAALGASAAMADRMVKLLQRQRILVRVDALLFHEEALKRLKTAVASLKAGDSIPARIDVAAFKERFGVTRKFAIPLLEYLDRERVTRRAGDVRVVL